MMIELIGESTGPTAIICSVLGGFAFILHNSVAGIAFLSFAGLMIIIGLICAAILHWRGEL